ncbi:MAG: bacterial Ig-like domain-containing protein [Clostridia bacterium]|nr:bacterial Ig-like domain-containing protein [Clostridia bacterium]
MKNQKLIKKIAATVVCSAMALTAFSFAACNGDGGESGEHKHTYSTEWSSNGVYHWHDATCEHEDMYSDMREHTFADGECSVCGAVEQVIRPTKTEADDVPPEYDADGKLLVKYEFTAHDYEAKTYEEDMVAGIFTIGAGTTIRARTRTELYDESGNKIEDVNFTKSIQVSANESLVKINAPAAGTLVIYAQYGSSAALNTHSLSLVKPDGSTTSVNYRATGGALQRIEVELDKGGVYQIKRASATSDIFYMSFTAKVEDTPVQSIQVGSAGNVDYYVGQTFNVDGLAVNSVHQTTGRISPVDNERLEIDYKNFDNTKQGTYEIKVSYTKSGSTFSTSYNVNVYSFDSLKLGTDKIVQGSNSAAGNGVYANQSLRQFYFTGETLSLNGLSVILNGKNGETSKTFLLKDTQYTVSAVDMNTAGKKAVTVSVTTNGVTKQGTFDIYVVEKDSALATATSVDLVVNGSTTDANIGVKDNDGAYQFKTVHQAIEFLENCGISDSAKKTINLKAGYYWEKLEINVPNLTIIGEDVDNTMIEYDALYGLKDDGGFEHTTDSTATLNVRDKAVNFTIKNVTVSNYYNSLAHFDEKLGAGYGEHRALALLVQADQVTIDNCALLGYQDTVEFFTGRQYLVNSYIAGTTDFIFGTNNTTYFYGCEIHSIYNGSTDGGYITAFKGNNKGAADAVTYGAIFDNCHFTADDEVTDGNTAIGRPWGSYAAVAVINSEIEAHVSTEGYAGASKNTRYVSMSGVAPTADTVKFVEYNNTGDGAITEAVAGMKMLTAAEAKNYSDLSVIFGTKNGGVSYSSIWLPVRPDAETHTVTVYTDNGTQLGTLVVENGSAILPEQIQGIVAADDTYKTYDIVGVYSDDLCETEYTYPEITADGNVYVKLHFEAAIVSSTTITFKDGANYADLITGGKLTVTPAEGSQSAYREIKTDCIGFNEGAEISFEVKAGTTIIVDAYGSGYTSFTVLIDGVTDEELGTVTDDCEFTVDSNCTVKIVCGSSASLAGANYLKSITVEVPHTYAHGETITLTDYDGEVIQNGAIGKWNGIIIDTTNGGANNGKFASRVPSNNDIQCAVGTVLTFNVEDGVTANDITIISYQNTPVAEGAWSITVEGGVAVIECISTASNHNYIMAIEIA